MQEKGKNYKFYIEHDPTILRVKPKLAGEIGLNESMVLLQLNFWIKNSNNFKEGKRWTYQSIREMKDKAFPFWSKDTINRTIKNLKERNLIIISNFNKKKYDKTRWFAINWEQVQKLDSTIVVKKNNKGVSQNETGVSQNETRSAQNETTIPETTTETTTKNNTYSEERKEKLRQIFDHWLEKESTITHRKLSKNFKKHINARLEDGFTVDELKLAIDNYDKANRSDKYYWSHDGWTIGEFMGQEEGGRVETFLQKVDTYLKNDSDSSDEESKKVYKNFVN